MRKSPAVAFESNSERATAENALRGKPGFQPPAGARVCPGRLLDRHKAPPPNADTKEREFSRASLKENERKKKKDTEGFFLAIKLSKGRHSRGNTIKTKQKNPNNKELSCVSKKKDRTKIKSRFVRG